jgi:hypothetical protein
MNAVRKRHFRLPSVPSRARLRESLRDARGRLADCLINTTVYLAFWFLVALSWVFPSVRRWLDGPRRLRQPRCWNDDGAWDMFWRAVLQDEEERDDRAFGTAPNSTLDWAPLLRASGKQRVLFAGNGIHLEPHALAHCGFEMTALDISPAACRYVAEAQLDEEQLFRLFPSRERMGKAHRPGGSVKTVAESLFRYAPERKYDFIYSRRAFAQFTEAEQRGLARRFFHWLAPGGICLVETWNLHSGERFRQMDQMFREAGFLLPRHELPPSPDAVDEGQELTAEARCLLEGGKMAILWHGSG